MNPQFPLYIVSKGRADTRLTSKTLEKMNTPYSVIIEEQEYSEYAKVIDKKKLIVLDKSYQEKYDTCDKASDKSKGSGPARNFAWDHSIDLGHKWHWVMDDNLRDFYRVNNNVKIRVGNGTIFKCMEDFVLRYTNIGMAGPQYDFLASLRLPLAPYIKNTRIYSCNLINNSIPFRWRGRHNEDTILSLDVLKGEWCTVLFNAFLQGKMHTMTMKGGNSGEFYFKEGRMKATKLLIQVHPDFATLTHKFNRVHHRISFKPFKKMKLIKRDDVEINQSFDNYGMKVTQLNGKT